MPAQIKEKSLIAKFAIKDSADDVEYFLLVFEAYNGIVLYSLISHLNTGQTHCLSTLQIKKQLPITTEDFGNNKKVVEAVKGAINSGVYKCAAINVYRP